MKNQNVSRETKMMNVVGAGVAGGGLGSVFAVIANGMSDSIYKSVLIVSAPIITIGISGVWLFLKTVFLDPYIDRKKDEVIQNVLSNERANMEFIMNDPSSSEEHKKQACEKFQKIQTLVMDWRIETVKGLIDNK